MISMRTFIGLLVALCFLLSYPAFSSLVQFGKHHSSTPHSEPAGDKHDRIVEIFIAWILKNSDYKDFGHPRPKIVRANQKFMDDLWAELNDNKEPPGDIGAMHVWRPSAKDEDKSTIYIPVYFNINYVLDKKMLIHELVHHLQRWNNTIAVVECHSKLEYDAYMLAAKYLKSVGYDNYAVIKGNEDFAVAKSQCSTVSNSNSNGKYRNIPKPNWFGKL